MRGFLARFRRDSDAGEHELPLSMVDVTFLLLIFFMCSMQFKSVEQALGAALPKYEGLNPPPPPPPPERMPIRVKIHWANARGQVIHSPTTPYSDKFEGLRRPLSVAGAHVAMKVGSLRVRDLNDLARTLQDLVAREQMPVVIDARQAVPFRWVIGALDACARAKVEEVKFQSPRAPAGGGDDWWWM